jgi:hypothetical protein
MTYIQFIDFLKGWISGTTISGSTSDVFIKSCLVDEIEISELDYEWDFRVYITPQPIEIMEQNRAKYTVGIYIVGAIGLSPMLGQRFQTYSDCIRFFEAFVQQIPDTIGYGIQFPMVAEPVLLWDQSVDGLLWTVSMITGIDCI